MFVLFSLEASKKDWRWLFSDNVDLKIQGAPFRVMYNFCQKYSAVMMQWDFTDVLDLFWMGAACALHERTRGLQDGVCCNSVIPYDVD